MKQRLPDWFAVGACIILAGIMIIAKEWKLIDWSWWVVLSPVWIPFAATFFVVIMFLVGIHIIGMIERYIDNKRQL